MDGLTILLDGRPPGEPVPLTAVRTRMPRHASRPRVTEVLADLDLERPANDDQRSRRVVGLVGQR